MGGIVFLGLFIFAILIYAIVCKIQEIVYNKDNAAKERRECERLQKELRNWRDRLQKQEEILWQRKWELDLLDSYIGDLEQKNYDVFLSNVELYHTVNDQANIIESLQQSPTPTISMPKNDLLEEKHEKFSKEKAEFEKKQKEQQALYQKALENLQFIFYDQYDISKMLDAVAEGRLNNAFGSNLSFAHIDVEAFIQSIHEDGTQQTYKVSLSECDCEYFKKQHLPCKHMLFLAYSLAVLQVNSEKLATTQQISIQKICENAQIISKQEFQIKKNEKKLDNILKKIKKIGSQSRQ